MRRRSLVGVGLLAATLVWADSAVAQYASPIDTVRAIVLLREAAASLRVSEILQEDEEFQRHLAFLFQIWGEEWSPLPRPEAPVAPRAHEVTDSLTRRGEVDRAIAIALELDGAPRRRALVPILDWMVEHGETDRMLSFADSIGESRSGVVALLSTSRPRPTPWRIRAERIGRFLQEESRDTAAAQENWATLVRFVRHRDLAAAWDLAETNLGPPHRTGVQLGLLGFASARGGLRVDSLIGIVHERILRLSEGSARVEQLLQLTLLCRNHAFEACGRLSLPENPRMGLPHLVANRFRSAMEAGRWDEAEAIGDTLRDLVRPDEYHLAVSEALEKATPLRGYDSVSATLVPRLDSAAASMPGASGDRLNARLAGLWAVQNPDRARQAIARMESRDLRIEALRNLAGAAHLTDLPLAIEALRRGGPASRGLDLGSLYADALRWRDSARAREIFQLLPDGAERMHARLLWAGIVRGAGRWAEAHRLAFEALEEWDPVAEPRPVAFGLFRVFAALGVYDELIAWARDWETADGRASALAAIVGSVGSYRAPGSLRPRF